MKKYILILFTLVLFIPTIVFAGRGEPPVFINYDVEVTNKDGIILTPNISSIDEVKIPYGTKLSIQYEYEKDNKLYGSVEYNDTIGMIEINKNNISLKNVDVSKYKLDKQKKVLVFGKGTYLYDGPSKIYDAISEEVEPGTVLNYNFGDDSWAFVNYKGKNGWIYTYTYDDVIYTNGAKVATYTSNSKLYTLKEIELIDSPITKNKINQKIPSLNEINYEYYYAKDPNTIYYYVSYEDKKGWYEYKPLEVAEVNNEDFVVDSYEENDIYEKPNLESKIIATVKKDEEYNVLATSVNDNIDDNSYESWTYIKYNNIKGWIYHYEKDDKTEKENINTPKEKDEKKEKKGNSSIKIISFLVAAIIIILFIIYTIFKFVKPKEDKK